MELDLAKGWKATFIAPLASSFGLTLALFLRNPTGEFNLISKLQLILNFLPITYPLSFIGLCLLGWPCALVLRKFDLLNFYSLSFSGFVLGFLTSFIFERRFTMSTAIELGIVGFVVAVAAAVLMKSPPNKFKNENASKAGTDAAYTRRPF